MSRGQVLLCDTPAEGELNWLASRIRSFGDSVSVSSDECLNFILGHHHQPTDAPRQLSVILFCADRLSFKPCFLESLTASAPDIPIAVATSSWWEGASRTGIVACNFPIIPWYRWQDGWVPWLTGTHQPFHEYPSARPLGAVPRDHWSSKKRTGVLGRGTMAQVWLEILRNAGSEAILLSAKSLRGSPGSITASAGRIERLIWDDSCLDTSLPRTREEEQKDVETQIRLLHSLYPETPICTAFSMPRWNTWQAAMNAGATEILAKPA